jgi:hypothetical protein
MRVIAAVDQAQQFLHPFVQLVVAGYAQQVAVRAGRIAAAAVFVAHQVEELDGRFVLQQGGLRRRGTDVVPGVDHEGVARGLLLRLPEIGGEYRAATHRPSRHLLPGRQLAVEIVDGQQLDRHGRPVGRPGPPDDRLFGPCAHIHGPGRGDHHQSGQHA